MGMFTLAAPVRDASGEVIGALTLSGPKDRLLGSIDPYEVAEEVWRARVKPQLDSLLAQCAAFSRELGWQGEQEDI